MYVDEKLLRSNEILFVKGDCMKCINCGAEIKSEYKMCPYCGTNIQIVPDYSVFDEEDIKIIVESATEPEKKSNIQKEQNEAKALAKQKAMEEAAKKRKMKLTIALVAVGCLLVIILGVFAKVTIDKNNNNSYEYQMKQADSAMFKGDMDSAEKYYLKALALDANSIEVRLELADLYLKKEDTAQAEKYLNQLTFF